MDAKRRKASRYQDTEGEARYLIELIRSGLDRRRVELAAYLGDKASQLATGVDQADNTSLYHLSHYACLVGTKLWPRLILTWAVQEVAQLYPIMDINAEHRDFWWSSLLLCSDYVQSGAYAKDNIVALQEVTRLSQILQDDADWQDETEFLVSGLCFDILAQLMQCISFLVEEHQSAAAGMLERIPARLEAIADIVYSEDPNIAYKSIPNLIKILKNPEVRSA